MPRVDLRVSEQELAAWKAKAGGNLSEWIRGRCNEWKPSTAYADGDKLVIDGTVRTVRMAEVRESDRSAVPSPADAGDTSSAKKPKTCAHGVSKGYRCWQCKGIAVIE